MIGKRGLLSILQFVAVILPAFVVVMEIVVSREIGDKIEIYSVEIDEFRLLEYSLVFIIAGTGLILYRLLIFIQNVFVVYGVLFIFGSIPLSLVSLWIMRNRRSYDQQSDETISENIQKNIREVVSKIILLLPIPLISATLVFVSGEFVNNTLSIGIFYNGWVISPHQFVLIGFVVCAIKGLISVNSRYDDLNLNVSEMIGSGIGVGIVLNLVYLLVITPVYAFFKLLLYIPDNYFSIHPSNLIFNFPFVVAGVLYYLLLVFDYDPNISSDETT